MGFLELMFRGLVNLICGGPTQDQRPPQAEPPTHDVYVPPSVPHRPSKQEQNKPYRPQEHRPPQQQQYTRPEEPRPPKHKPSSPGQRVDLNQINQQNSHYTSLRARANEEGDQMARCFEESHQAYSRGDGALAKDLSNKGKRHKSEMEKLHNEASEWIFSKNNEDSQPGEIDLHGLYVKEAISYTDRSIQEARQRGDTEIRLIVGKGLHSKGSAKIKPAIEDLMRKHGLIAEFDPQNAGVLIVSLDGHDKGTGRVLRPDDITRQIENKDGGCLIM